PTSATNLEWFATRLCGEELERARQAGTDGFAFVDREVATVAGDASDVLYLPFLYGSPLPGDASATFLGVRGWHTRAHLLRAVLEGIVFTHRHHLSALDSAFPSGTVRLTGGASRSPRWRQIFSLLPAPPYEVSPMVETFLTLSSLMAGIFRGVCLVVPVPHA